MNKYTKLLAVGFGLCLSASAWAGLKTTSNVTVDQVQRRAQGTLGSARNSADNSQYILCSTSWSVTGGNYTLCQAGTATGVAGVCSTNSPDFARLAATINGDSDVIFTWDAKGVCQSLGVYQGSDKEPKR
jgi:hypothetical protein